MKRFANNIADPTRTALLLGALAMVVTLSLFGWLRSLERDSHQTLFAEVFDSHRLALQRTLQRRVVLLEELRAFFHAGGNLTRDAFTQLTTPLLRHHPEIQSLEWVPRVTSAQRSTFEQAARRDGLESFQFTERGADDVLVRAGRRDHYFPVFYAEPYSGNTMVLGYDLNTQTQRRKALETAWMHDMPVASAPLRLVQADTDETGFLLVLPVYRPDSLAFTSAGRAQGLNGFVIGVFQLKQLFTQAFSGTHQQLIELGLQDVTNTHPLPLQGSAPESIDSHAPALHSDIAFGTRHWRLSGRPSERFTASLSHQGSWLVLLLGGAASLWLAGFGYRRQRALQHTEQLVRERTSSLRKSEERLRHALKATETILEALPVGMLLCDRERVLRHANSAAQAILGKPRKQIEGQICHGNICPSQPGQCPVWDRNCQVEAEEQTVLGHNGQAVPVLKTITPLTLDGEKLLLATFVDITPLKQAQQNLADESARRETLNQLLRASLNTSQRDRLLVNSLDILSDLVFVTNEGAAAFLAHPQRQELTLLSSRGLPEPLKQACASVPFGHCLCGRAARDGVLRHARVGDPEHDNGYPGMPVREFYSLPIQVDGVTQALLVIYLAHGSTATPEITAFLASVCDLLSVALTRIASQQHLVQARLGAEAASEAKSRFLATMSHEIRTPLNAVLGMAELLADTQLDPQQRDYLGTVTESGHNLLRILNDILDFSRIENAGLSLESVLFDLEKTAFEAARLMAGRAADKGLEMILDFDPDCPRYLEGDPGRLRQILLGLLDNAVKFTERGHVLLRISGEPTESGRTLIRLAVSDTGIGIDPAQQQRLFAPFSQGDDSATRNHGGTGLGLAICRQLANLMDGEISVNSSPGAGAEFTVSLNLRPSQAPPMLPSVSLDRARVLLVDDNPINRRVIGEQLRHMNLAVVQRPGGAGIEEFVLSEAANDQPFDLVLLDQNMPDFDGEALGAALRDHPELDALALLLLTSTAQRGDAERFSRAGFDAYLPKPVSRDLLRRTLAQALTMRQKGDVHAMITRHSIADSRAVPAINGAPLNGRVLLAEDNPTNRQVGLSLLRQLGLHAEAVENGRLALHRLADKAYDLVLMDCQMPDLDGYQATRQIRAHADQRIRRIPIIALTTNAMAEDHRHCLDTGMNDTLAKPYSGAELAHVLGRWLGKAEPLPSTDLSINTQPPAMPERVFDPSVLDPLREAMGEDFAQLPPAYLDEMQTFIDTLEAQWAAANTQQITRLGHSIKSSSAAMGGLRLAALGKALEQQAASVTPDIIKELREEFLKLRPEIEGYAKQGSTRINGAMRSDG